MREVGTLSQRLHFVSMREESLFWKHFPRCELVHTGRAILLNQITSWENQLATSFKMKPWQTHPSFLEMGFVGWQTPLQIHCCVLAVQRWPKFGLFRVLLCIYHCSAYVKQHRSAATIRLKGSRDFLIGKNFTPVTASTFLLGQGVLLPQLDLILPTLGINGKKMTNI